MTWFPQYEVSVDHRCWNSHCDCNWRRAKSSAYKPSRQTLAEESCCTVYGAGVLTYVLSGSLREVPVPVETFDR